jgi:hexosaminidase
MIREFHLACVVLLVACPAIASQPVIPVPAHVETRDGVLSIDSSFAVSIKGTCDHRLRVAVDRLTDRIQRETGIPFHGSGDRPPTLVVSCTDTGGTIPTPGDDESYTLDVSAGGALLQAPSSIGAVRGLETFWQLMQPGTSGVGVPALHIADSPRFPWRGLLIDVARHWIPPDVIKRNLDAMSTVKLNVLHFHLSEDQGFRVECKRFPKLHQLGSDGHYFTQDEIREIIRYAAERGIRVIPEFDMPGHTTSWFVGYPELASAPGPYAIERTWGVFDPTMDPTREETYEFLDGFIGEMARLFPDPYFHIGGDEVNGKQWDSSATIAAFKKQHGMSTNRDLQAYFNKRLEMILSRYGKRMIGWDEIFHPDLPTTIVIQSWRGPASLAEIARSGYRGILSNGYYLDHMMPASYHYAIDPRGGEAAALDSIQAQRILGGEACMWAEFVTAENVDSRIWPRAAAVAERLWSPASVRDSSDMYRRLDILSPRLEWVGVRERPNRTLMLERLTGYRDISPLQRMQEVLEPVKFYVRSHTGKYTSWTPLNRLVDATLPESREARRFGEAVDSLLADRGTVSVRRRIRERLIRWSAVDVQPLVAQSALLHEIDSLAVVFNGLAKTGLEALTAMEQKTVVTPEQRAGWLRILGAADRPYAELLITIAGPVRRLAEAALLR